MAKRSKKTNKPIMYLGIAIIILYALWFYFTRVNEKIIAKQTDLWIHNVTTLHDPESIYKLFCSDGNLVGTVSQVKRKGIDIKRYFDYFATLPGIQVINKKYNISKVTSNVYLNTAFITWKWDDLDEPITARMTFLYRGKCIFQLHSSSLPDLNESLFKISDLA
jgi:hypothetical protein